MNRNQADVVIGLLVMLVCMASYSFQQEAALPWIVGMLNNISVIAGGSWAGYFAFKEIRDRTKT